MTLSFDPETNRIQTMHLTPSELNEITTAKHGVMFYSGGSWHDKTGGQFYPTDVYRAKPAPAPTIMVNGIAVPEPVREALESGTKYYVANVCSAKWHDPGAWRGADYMRLSRGLIHLTEAAAVAHARAMVAPGMKGGV